LANPKLTILGIIPDFGFDVAFIPNPCILYLRYTLKITGYKKGVLYGTGTPGGFGDG
jgi:hypothetical protein